MKDEIHRLWVAIHALQLQVKRHEEALAAMLEDEPSVDTKRPETLAEWLARVLADTRNRVVRLYHVGGNGSGPISVVKPGAHYNANAIAEQLLAIARTHMGSSQVVWNFQVVVFSEDYHLSDNGYKSFVLNGADHGEG